MVAFQLILNGVSLGAVYAMVAVGFALVFNILKFSNFSQGGVITVTAYAGFIVNQILKTNFFVTLVVTAVIGGFVALAVERLAFRRLRTKQSPVILYFVSSITMGILLENLIVISFSSNFYSYPKFFKTTVVKFLGLTAATSDLLMLVISVLALAILMLILHRTKIGIAVRALSMDGPTTSLMGVNVSLAVSAVFFMVGALGGMAGVFLGINYTLYPQIGQMIVKGFIASVIGGLGNIAGAVIGAFLLGLLEVGLTSIDWIGSGLAPVVVFLVTLVFLILRPQGIAGRIIHEKA
jgi:branched-chain amino acid transport system permease protein